MKPSVLFVDDDPDVLDGLSHLLRGKPVQAYFARSAQQGWCIVQTQEIDVIVSDERMPRITGNELLTRISKTHPQIVRILLTGQADWLSVLRAINESEVFRFLVKPIRPEELLEQLQQAIAFSQRVKQRG